MDSLASTRDPRKTPMYVVAIVAVAEAPLRGPEELAAAIGGGLTALELRMATSAVAPSPLLRTPSRERAEEVARVLSAAGHAALAVDLGAVTPVERMVRVHRFTLEASALHADARGPAIAFEDITAILRVAVETSVLRTTHEKEIEPARGGRTERDVEHTRAERALEHAAFLLGGDDDDPPWVLRAGEARYLGLGAALRPTTLENFHALLSLLRARAPRAAYDERFAVHPILRHAQGHVRGYDTAAPELGDEAVELRVHLLGRMMRGSRSQGPYR